jgi:ABC-type transporter Mla MlaB component
MPAADFKLDGDTLRVVGLLSVDTVSEYYEPGLDAISRHAGLTVDLAEAEIKGSAGVALLIAFQRRARDLDKSFAIVNAPEHFLNMAKVSGVADILPFA